ncbi:hypothetical protein EST38_g9599 [Candolleomyces aberdarensis]|uniref:Uncharacterized protein n=1 Tax=Candolleomyces aberdarensis TaxID=2316362 RepID=A0A4Q2DCT2_9AGAR|nr:hypothetical protein EST38_g9599 [Candolleomyces aberdarensis]
MGVSFHGYKSVMTIQILTPRPSPSASLLQYDEGTLGLPAFASILTDPRTQDIPLILETPSFEKPKEVWGVEISVLNRLSERAHGGVDVSEDAEESGIQVNASLTQVDNEKLVEEVSVAVKAASKATATKPKAVKATSSRKRKSGRDESDEDESECDG